MSRALNLAGLKIGKITAKARTGSDRHGALWWCQCDCGNKRVVHASKFKQGKVLSCVQCSPAKGKYGSRGGQTRHPLRKTWERMLDRCYNPRHQSYVCHGARGIEVCARWRESFAAFLEDVGERPAGRFMSGMPMYTLDRIDVNGNYEPGNVRWATAKEQRANQRKKVAA